MTQPNLAFPPNPEHAKALRQLQIPATMPGWLAFRDYQLDVAENGITQDQAPMHMARTVDTLAAAQLDTIAVQVNLQNGMKQVTEVIQTFIYKKKEPAPTDGATTHQ
jgi:hypothetical protein